jgi:hypothetical protein
MRYVWTLALAAACAGACTPGTDTATAKASVVDSVVPRDVALANFRRCCASTDSLTGGAPSRDSLVVRFVRAIESKDTAALRSMLLTRGEFAWLYYDTNPQSRPPYNLSPSLMWFLTEGNSSKGIGRALDEYANKPLRYLGYACDSVASHEGANTVWGPCAVKVRGEHGDTMPVRLFGQLIERGGRWKFVSYANKL